VLETIKGYIPGKAINADPWLTKPVCVIIPPFCQQPTALPFKRSRTSLKESILSIFQASASFWASTANISNGLSNGD
jgi:hypothetical protein